MDGALRPLTTNEANKAYALLSLARLRLDCSSAWLTLAHGAGEVALSPI